MTLYAMVLALGALAAPADNPFRVEARDATIAPGATGAVTVYLVVPPKHHVFRDVLEVSVTDAGGLVPGAPSYPPGVMVPDTTGTNGGMPRESYEADVLVDVPITVPAGTPPGPRSVDLHVRYQGCSATSCFFPREEDLRARVDVPSAAPAPAPLDPARVVPRLPATAPTRTGCDTGTGGDVTLLALAIALPAIARTRRPGVTPCRPPV